MTIRTIDEYRADDARAMDELEEIDYLVNDYFSYAEIPDDAYNTRFRTIVADSQILSPAGKRYLLATCLKEGI